MVRGQRVGLVDPGLHGITDKMVDGIGEEVLESPQENCESG